VGIREAALVPGGKTAALGCDDKTARLFDLATSKPMGPALWHPSDDILALSAAPDGRSLAVAYGDGVWLWPLPQPMEGNPEEVRLWVQQLTGPAH
jgi:WD40 repeat protein